MLNARGNDTFTLSFELIRDYKLDICDRMPYL